MVSARVRSRAVRRALFRNPLISIQRTLDFCPIKLASRRDYELWRSPNQTNWPATRAHSRVPNYTLPRTQGFRVKISSLSLFTALLATPLLASVASAQSGSGAPTLTVRAEEPTGVFYDRDTLGTQTPILFTARVENPATENRQVDMDWRITDSAGRQVLRRTTHLNADANELLVRRELFDANARGAYLLDVSAKVHVKGPDFELRQKIPFAIITAPPVGARTVARPQSFFVLSTPGDLSPLQLDFYGRMGARVLRSPLPIDPTNPNWNAVETQLGERIRRNLATIALLPLGDDDSGRSQAFWSRQVPANLARYGALSTWELSGEVAPADLDAWAQVARARRADVKLLGPLPTGLPTLPANASVTLKALDGATFNWPTTPVTHPAALRRLWLSRAQAARNAGLSSFYLRRDVPRIPGAKDTPDMSAGSLTADYLSAIVAGASSMAESLAPPRGDDDGQDAMARGAAFAMLSRTLEDAAFKEELFPKSPMLEGALFQLPHGGVAVVYAPEGKGQMELQLAQGRAVDVFGNTVATARDGKLKFDIAGQPIYVFSDGSPDVLSFALNRAKTSGLQPFAAQMLPLSRDAAATEPGSAAIRVRLQNIGLGPQKGSIELDVPRSWKPAQDKYDVNLAEGESKTYEFRLLETTTRGIASRRDGDPFRVIVRANNRTDWRFDPPVATALNVAPGARPIVDGDLDDWKDAIWMNVGPNAAKVKGRLAFKWDAQTLYLAAEVHEPALAPRRVEETSYDFWRGHDAIQLAFGTSDTPETAPARAPFRDSDLGFLIAPFGQSGAGQYEGRVLKLWGNDLGFNRAADRVRWGGQVPGSDCAIARDERGGVTTYEAAIPLSALPDVDPQKLAQRDDIVRFGWLLHNDEGEVLDWGRENGNFPWWDNTATFLPEGRLTSALRGTLGFTLQGAVDGGTGTAPPPPIIAVPPTQPPVVAPLPPLTIPQITPPPTVQPTTPAPLPPPVILPPPPTTRPLPGGRPLPPGPIEIPPFVIPPPSRGK